MTQWQVGDRVYVDPRSTDGPFGPAEITEIGVNGIGDPTFSVRLDEYITMMGKMVGRDASGRDWRDWGCISLDQLKPLR